MIVKRGISLGDALELVVEVDDYLSQRQHEMQFHAVAAHILLVDQFSALVETQCHYRAYEVGGGDDGRPDIRLLDMVYHRLFGQSRRVVYFFFPTLLVVAHI